MMFIALLVDLVFQVSFSCLILRVTLLTQLRQFYAFFMSWRYSAFLRQYAKVDGPTMGTSRRF